MLSVGSLKYLNEKIAREISLDGERSTIFLPSIKKPIKTVDSSRKGAEGQIDRFSRDLKPYVCKFCLPGRCRCP